MHPKTIVITGVSGYLGTILCRELDHRPWCLRIHGVDIAKPLYKFAKLDFQRMDINDAGLAEWLRGVEPHVLVHLAFIVNPIADEQHMMRVNVDGTRRVLEAAAGCGVSQIVVASSGTAYGAWPDNPVPLKETDPIRPHPRFRYANDKARVESMCAAFAETHPDITLAVVRPCVVYGPLVNNYLSKLLTGLPWVTALAGYDPPLQFVHEDDAARAILTVVREQAAGPFNVAPDDTIALSQVIELLPKRVIALPDWLLNPVAALAWRFGLPLLNAPPSFLDYMRYPWVLDNRRLRDELGVAFRYSSREALVAMLRAKGLAPVSERCP